MSFDLVVFDPSRSPSEPAPFLEWFDRQVDGESGRDSEDHAAATPCLQDWFLSMVSAFPPMNGPLSDERLLEDPDFDDSRLTGYSFTSDLIYADFRWSVADEAQDTAFALAQKHRVGFFDLSTSEVWLPGPEGYHVAFHTRETPSPEERCVRLAFPPVRAVDPRCTAFWFVTGADGAGEMSGLLEGEGPIEPSLRPGSVRVGIRIYGVPTHRLPREEDHGRSLPLEITRFVLSTPSASLSVEVEVTDAAEQSVRVPLNASRIRQACQRALRRQGRGRERRKQPWWRRLVGER